MDADVYSAMASTERTHWWFVGRRAIIRSLIEKRIQLRPDARILEAGCGTGGNLELLQQFGQLEAFELDEIARGIAIERSGIDVQPGHLPDGLSHLAGRYDLIALFDVLEHVGRDVEGLRALSPLLAPGGKMVLTVPALQFLWSDHDRRHHHHRRYTGRCLREVVEEAGLKVDYASYFNFLLLPLAAAQRLLSRLSDSQANLDVEPPRLVNELLSRTFAAEAALLARMPLPIGLSLCAICSAR